MKIFAKRLALASTALLLATIGCSGGTDASGDAAPREDDAPTSELNLLYTLDLEGGGSVAFYEVAAEPGLVMVLETVPPDTEPVYDGATNLSVAEIFKAISSEPLPQALAAANERQLEYRTANPIEPEDDSASNDEPPAAAPPQSEVATTSQALTEWEYFQQRCGALLSGYNYGLVQCQTQNYASRVCTWKMDNMRHGARIIYERVVNDAYMNIQYRKYNDWAVSVNRSSFGGDWPIGTRYIWTMPDTHNNYDYFYYGYSYNYGNMYTCAGFKD
jgi:hypothetical protein